jgi:hypothetical protein
MINRKIIWRTVFPAGKKQDLNAFLFRKLSFSGLRDLLVIFTQFM